MRGDFKLSRRVAVAVQARSASGCRGNLCASTRCARSVSPHAVPPRGHVGSRTSVWPRPWTGGVPLKAHVDAAARQVRGLWPKRVARRWAGLSRLGKTSLRIPRPRWATASTAARTPRVLSMLAGRLLLRSRRDGAVGSAGAQCAVPAQRFTPCLPAHTARCTLLCTPAGTAVDSPTGRGRAEVTAPGRPLRGKGCTVPQCPTGPVPTLPVPRAQLFPRRALPGRALQTGHMIRGSALASPQP